MSQYVSSFQSYWLAGHWTVLIPNNNIKGITSLVPEKMIPKLGTLCRIEHHIAYWPIL